MLRSFVVLIAVSTALCAQNVHAARAVMLQPLSTAWNSPLRSPTAVVFEVPVVLVLDWRDELAWTLELTPSVTHGQSRGVEYQSRRLLSAVGLTIFERAGGGFFATPKLFAVIAAEGEGSLATLMRRISLDTMSSQFSVGADVGYEWRFERLVVAVVAGMSAGAGHNMREADANDLFTASLVSAPLGGVSGRRVERRPVVDLNLNLLRVGVPF